jgi:hypothetical protein
MVESLRFPSFASSAWRSANEQKNKERRFITAVALPKRLLIGWRSFASAMEFQKGVLKTPLFVSLPGRKRLGDAVRALIPRISALVIEHDWFSFVPVWMAVVMFESIG